MAYGQTYGGSVDETDEEMERRIMAEIAARAPAATRTGELDDSGFDEVIGGLAGSRRAEPQPTTQQTPAQQPRAAEQPAVAPRVSRETATATGLGGDTTFGNEPRTYDRTPGRGTAGREVTGLGQGGAVNMSAIESGIDQRHREQTQALRDQARREERRQKILRGLGVTMTMLGGPQLGAGLMMAGNSVSREGRNALAGRREDIMRRAVEQRQREEQAKQERDAALAQGIAERRLALQERQFEGLSGYREAQLAQRDEQFDRSQGLRERTQGWRESQAELERAAKETRARIIAGQRVGGALGELQRPGSASGVSTEPAGVHPDSANIMAIRQTRGDIIAPLADVLIERAAAGGQQLSRADAEWQVARDIWANLSEKERRGLRGDLAAPPTSTSTASGERSAETRAGQREAEHRVPGWTRDTNAPQLGTEERARARNIAASTANVQRFTRRMEQLAQEVSRLEATAANARVVSEKMAEAAQVHEQLINELRTIGNYGVPQAAELARMEALAPRLSSREFFVGSAPGIYRAMRSTLDQRAGEQMRSLGYARGSGASGAAAGQWRPIGRTADGGIVYENAAGERRVRRQQ